MTFAYSFGRDKHDATPAQRAAATLEAFVADLEAHRAPKKDTAAYFCGPLNGDGKPVYLAVNCGARKLNATSQSGQWKSWDAPQTDFEEQLISDLCKARAS